MKKIAVTYIQPLDNKVRVTNRTCRVCANQFYFDGWFRNHGRYQSDVDNRCCHPCQFWIDNYLYDLTLNNGIVIGGEHYRLTTKSAGFNFGETVFRIRYLGETKVREVYLSGQGTPLKHLANLFPDNAEFVS